MSSPMDLQTFNKLAENWIKQFPNVKLSGVAEVEDQSKIQWSMSIAVVEEGIFPQPDVCNIEKARQLCQKHLLKDFALSHTYVIDFIMQPNLTAKRWQVQWLFRP